MLLGNPSVERNSSFFCNLHFVPLRLHGILFRITLAILPGRVAAGFNKQKNVAGKYGMRTKYIKINILSYLHLMSLNNLSSIFYRYWTSIAVIVTLRTWII